MYLILKSRPLYDQWECHADREPLTMTDDWQAWIEEFKPDFEIEVWEFDPSDREFKFITYAYKGEIWGE